mmetsp:Transcript_173901/g.422967  ORF Transcript_173901/g.422967 Transcript_173901/m.422967 type:complete len:117 (+) Transcript_173901:333-683(+)
MSLHSRSVDSVILGSRMFPTEAVICGIELWSASWRSFWRSFSEAMGPEPRVGDEDGEAAARERRFTLRCRVPWHSKDTVEVAPKETRFRGSATEGGVHGEAEANAVAGGVEGALVG